MKKCFIKGEAFRRLRTDSPQTTSEENIKKIRKSPDWKRLPCPYCEKVPLWVKIRRQENNPLTERQICTSKKPTIFCYTIQTIPPGFTYTEEDTMGKWHLIQNQQRLREIFRQPLLISYRKGKSLRDLLVRGKQITSITTHCRSRVLRLSLPSFKPGNLRYVKFWFHASLVKSNQSSPGRPKGTAV